MKIVFSFSYNLIGGFCGQTSLAFSIYTLPVSICSLYTVYTVFGIIKAFVGYFRVFLLLVFHLSDVVKSIWRTTSRSSKYCKFRTFRESFIFSNLRIFVEIKASRNGNITLSFTDVGKSCPICEFLTSQICLLTLFAKIKCSQNFRIYSI